MDSTQLHVGLDPQMLVDDWLIECTQGLTRRWHKPRRREEGPVLVADRPWEEALYFTYSNYCVVRDPADGLVKCWYEDLGGLAPGKGHPRMTGLLYAESEDGVQFRKPELDVTPVAGGGTNIVMGWAKGEGATDANPWGDTGVHSASVVIDPHAQRPEERFRCIFTRMTADGERGRPRGTACVERASAASREAGVRAVPESSSSVMS